ncbi:MAG: XrtA system polysaccharide deacetylase [Thermodesulfobacteriota bacterium]|nr:XrtA system polysaccharide deacetylase [Thermodesulfobacteriota bacterium]
MNHILITIDVEDWFQVENFKQYIPFSSWDSYELRVEKNTHKIFDLLDSQQSNPTNPKATFFILGWIAERLPHLVREIHARGHEVASHGYTHNLCNQQSHEELKTDLADSKKMLEDIISAPIYGYRAPSFSIDKDILKIIQDCGYLYDSSYNSFSMHGRYGQLSLSQNGRKGIAFQIPKTDHATSTKASIINHQSSILYELPISNIKLWNHIFPFGGGAYFRLIPCFLFRMGVKSILNSEKTYLLYLHPWEIDPEQPRVNNASTFFKFRHYVNLNKTASKLASFIETFKECGFITCHHYLEQTVTSNPSNL